MTDCIVDTCIFIDISRNKTEAINWLQKKSNMSIGISGFTLFEMLEGARNKTEMETIKSEFKNIPIYWLNEDEFNESIEIYSKMKLTFGVDVIDTIIAMTAIKFNIPLITLNKKHFSNFKDLQIIIPY